MNAIAILASLTDPCAVALHEARAALDALSLEICGLSAATAENGEPVLDLLVALAVEADLALEVLEKGIER